MESYRIEEGYLWPIAEIDTDVLKGLRVLQQSTKIALDHQRIITYRAGYADGGAYKWREVFSDLAKRAGG